MPASSANSLKNIFGTCSIVVVGLAGFRGTPLGPTLEYLADHPEFIGTLAEWHYAEWRHLLPTWSVEEAAAELATHTGRQVAPSTIVALVDGRLAGSASLLIEDMPDTENWSPWLGSVFVSPEWRGEGIGSAMVDRVVADATTLGFPRIHLLTTEAEGWYAPKGWRSLERRLCAGLPAVIMGLDLNPGSATFRGTRFAKDSIE